MHTSGFATLLKTLVQTINSPDFLTVAFSGLALIEKRVEKLCRIYFQKGAKEWVPVATDHSIANAQSKISSFPSCHQRFGDASAENPNFTQCPNSALTVP